MTKFETIDSTWPAPLNEAIPLKFISKNSSCFDSKVTKWLDYLKPDLVEDQSLVENDGNSESVLSDETNDTITSNLDKSNDNWMIDNYLLSIDGLEKDKLNSLANLTQTDLKQIVDQLIKEECDEMINCDLINTIWDNEFNLACKLIEKAQNRINELNSSDDIENF